MLSTQRSNFFANCIQQRRPLAQAAIRGDRMHPELYGTTAFYEMNDGTMVVTEVFGLPKKDGACGDGIFAFHIHEGSCCTGNAKEPFSDTGGHYNPNHCPHPEHAGDMPPLFSNNGYAWSAFFTNRFTAREIIGRTVIIHSDPDDFHTQPSGNSGAKIACGMIR